MATTMTARDICEQALRKARAFTVNDAGAPEEYLRVALDSLDIILAHVAGSNPVFALLTEPLPVTLVAGQATYDLPDEISPSWPVEEASFVASATLVDAGGNRTPIEIIRHDELDDMSGRLDQPGTPCKVYIDRVVDRWRDRPQMRIFPVVASAGWTIELRLQKFSPSFANPVSGIKNTGLRPSWNMWAIHALAAYLGDGTITTLQSGELRDLREQADKLFRELLAFDNRARDNAPYRTEAWEPY